MAFEAYCIVEIMGHQIIAGKVSEETHFGSPLMRVDVPKTSKRDSFTVYYGGGAIYKITPTTEEICAAFVEKQEPEPIKPYMLALPTMAAKVADSDTRYHPDPDGDYDDYDDYDPEMHGDEYFDEDDDPNEAVVPTTLLMHADFPRDADSSGNGAAGDGPDDDEIMIELEKQADEAKATEESETKPQ